VNERIIAIITHIPRDDGGRPTFTGGPSRGTRLTIPPHHSLIAGARIEPRRVTRVIPEN
jgi:hypothetical protein